MYLKLTNANPAHRGNEISLRADLVVTVHTSIVTREDGLVEQVTFVFCPPYGTWEVSETLDTVVKALNKAYKESSKVWNAPLPPNIQQPSPQ